MFPDNQAVCSPVTAPAVSDLSETPVELSIPDRVARLLAESRQHQLNRLQAANRRLGGHHAPDAPRGRSELALALEKRLAAHDLDPDHIEPAWALDLAPHDTLVTFMHAVLGS